MEYSASVRCGAPSCPEPPVWRFVAAVPGEPADVALSRPDVEFRCSLHMSLSALTWLPGLADGLMVVVGAVDSPALVADLAETVRMGSHLIDVDQLRPRRPEPVDFPRSVTVTDLGPATQLMPAVVVPVPGQLALPVDPS